MSLSGVVNNPRSSWLEYFGLPDDIDEYTLSDVTSAVSSYVLPSSAATPAATPAASVSSASSRDERLVTIADFANYMHRVGEPYRFMAAHRPRRQQEQEAAAPSPSPT